MFTMKRSIFLLILSCALLIANVSVSHAHQGGWPPTESTITAETPSIDLATAELSPTTFEVVNIGKPDYLVQEANTGLPANYLDAFALKNDKAPNLFGLHQQTVKHNESPTTTDLPDKPLLKRTLRQIKKE